MSSKCVLHYAFYHIRKIQICLPQSIIGIYPSHYPRNAQSKCMDLCVGCWIGKQMRAARPLRLKDEMAYRGHQCCDIDGQSDIASLIFSGLSPQHTLLSPCHAHFSPSVSFNVIFLTSARTHALSPVPFLSPAHLCPTLMLSHNCSLLFLSPIIILGQTTSS